MKPIRSAEPKRRPIPHPGFDTDAFVVAAREAVRAALARHKALGHQVVTWRDGQVVLLQPENINL